MKSLRRVSTFMGWLTIGFLIGVAESLGFIFIHNSLFGGLLTVWRLLFVVTIACSVPLVYAIFLVALGLVGKGSWALRVKGIAGGLGLFLVTVWIVILLLERIFITFN